MSFFKMLKWIELSGATTNDLSIDENPNQNAVQNLTNTNHPESPCNFLFVGLA